MNIYGLIGTSVAGSGRCFGAKDMPASKQFRKRQVTQRGRIRSSVDLSGYQFLSRSNALAGRMHIGIYIHMSLSYVKS